MRLYLLSLFLPISTLICDCIVQNETLSREMNGNINPVVGYGYEWWYYVMNTKIGYGGNFYDSSIILFFGRTPIDDCNSFRNNKIFGYVDVKSTNKNINTNYNFNTIGDFNLNYYYHDTSNDNIWNITRIQNRLLVFISSHNLQLNMIIDDGRGIYPQGYNGFSRSGPNECDTAYAYSLPRAIIYGYMNKNIFQGLGYGEHVIGTIRNRYSIYDGWHCHYIHDMEKYEDYQLCVSDRIDNKIDLYQRGLVLDSNSDLIKLNSSNIFTNGFGDFKTFKVDWNISIQYPNDNINFEMEPLFEDQTRNIFGFSFWNGFVIDKLNMNILGITELVGF